MNPLRPSFSYQQPATSDHAYSASYPPPGQSGSYFPAISPDATSAARRSQGSRPQGAPYQNRGAAPRLRPALLRQSTSLSDRQVYAGTSVRSELNQIHGVLAQLQSGLASVQEALSRAAADSNVPGPIAAQPTGHTPYSDAGYEPSHEYPAYSAAPYAPHDAAQGDWADTEPYDTSPTAVVPQHRNAAADPAYFGGHAEGQTAYWQDQADAYGTQPQLSGLTTPDHPASLGHGSSGYGQHGSSGGVSPDQPLRTAVAALGLQDVTPRQYRAETTTDHYSLAGYAGPSTGGAQAQVHQAQVHQAQVHYDNSYNSDAAHGAATYTTPPSLLTALQDPTIDTDPLTSMVRAAIQDQRQPVLDSHGWNFFPHADTLTPATSMLFQGSLFQGSGQGVAPGAVYGGVQQADSAMHGTHGMDPA